MDDFYARRPDRATIGHADCAALHTIHWPDGEVRFRLDLSHPDDGLVIEYDGWQHVESQMQWGSDLDRRDWLDGDDWPIVVVIAKDLHRTPAATLSRIRAAMRGRGMSVPPVDDEWRRHFPSTSGARGLRCAS